MELHDTQTNPLIIFAKEMFDYPMELHDTQTSNPSIPAANGSLFQRAYRA